MRAMQTTLVFFAAGSFALSLVGAAVWCDHGSVLGGLILGTALCLAAAAGGAVHKSGWLAVLAATAAVASVSAVVSGILVVIVSVVFDCPESG
jgi:hypothetical protein